MRGGSTPRARLSNLLHYHGHRLSELPSRTALRLIHPFPAPMSPSLARTIIAGTTDQGDAVLDPMAGSGTVPGEAASLGRVCWAFDIDPLARLMIRVLVATPDRRRIERLATKVAAEALSNLREPTALDALFEARFDDESKTFVRHWFPRHVRRALLALWTCIEQVRSPAARDLLALAFSRVIIAKYAGASKAIDLPHTRPHFCREKKVPNPLEMFPIRLRELLDRLSTGNARPATTKVEVRDADARELPLGRASVDLVITSSPYANAIDYMRAHKFSLVWMGYSISELRSLRARMIGAELKQTAVQDSLRWLENHLPSADKHGERRRGMFRRYFYDMDRVLAELHRVIRPGGACVLVVGRSTVGDDIVDTPALVARLAEERGFEHIDTRFRQVNPLRRSLPFSNTRLRRNPLGKRIAQEAVVSLGR